MSQDNVVKLPKPRGPDLPPILYDGRGAGRRSPGLARSPRIRFGGALCGTLTTKLLEGKIADLTNISGGPFAGSISGSVPAPLRPTDEGELGVSRDEIEVSLTNLVETEFAAQSR
jgi:hypothetical protein